MQNDSVQLSASDHVKHVNNRAVSQESFQCGHCTLIFYTKVYLLEHLKKVHGFDVDCGLNSSETKQISADNSREKCQHCDFRTGSLDVLKKHVNKCRATSENLKGTGNIFENTDSKITDGLTKQHDEAAGAEEIPSVLSTSKDKPSSSNELKTYKRPLQHITKYFSTSVSNEETPEMSADGTTGTLILQDSPSSSNPNSSGVFKVTAKSMIDISSDSKSYLFSQTENFFTADMKPPKLREHFKETELDNSHKRTKKVDGHSVKKAKLDDEEVKRPEKETANKNLAFEFSEDEEEKKAARINGDAKSPKMYCCKHCDYSNVDIASLSSHYQDDHPYIRCNAVYIQDSHDQSATFRCLKCPVEFLRPSDLKRHYVKNHPEEPDVFTMKSHELSLLFKCFVCQFTTNILKSLKNHYKENHATLEVDNSLFFCRYSVVGSQEESSHLNICETTRSPERSEAISPKSASFKDTEAAASPQHCREDLYKCNKCKFSHKSAVVMQVHYQKYHPDKEVTLDKIKQLVQITPEKSPNSTVKVATPLSSSDTSKEKKDKAKVQEKNTSLSPKTKTVEPVEDGSKTKKLLNKRKRESSPPADSSFCSDTSDRSFSRHHDAKLSVHAPTNTKESLGFSGEVQRKKHRSDAETSRRTSSPHSKTEKPSSAVASKNIYMHAEKLFYCYKCNYGNPSIFGVMTHQAKTHQGINTSGKHVSTYSAVIREEIKKSKLNPKDSSFSTLLPLPLMNKGDENMFFCHFCNYRKSTVSQVMAHYSRRHHGFEVLPSQIQQYTSMVLKEMEKLQPKSSRNHQGVSREESPERGENTNQKMKNLSEKLVDSASTSAPLTQRSLQCFRCTFRTQYVYMLKKHLRKIHNSKWTVTQVLRMCLRKGMLQPGYHCELCVFSHDKAAEVYMHYKEHHRRYKSSFEFVSTRLYAGPKTTSPKEKKQKCAEKEELFDSYQVPLEFDKSFDDVTASPTLFKCPYCSASFNTKRGVTIHCRIKHILTEKEKQQEAPAQTGVHIFKCLHCAYVSTSYHGAITHTKMKHPSLSSKVNSLHVDSSHIKHCNDKRIGPDGSLKLSGHMCGTCSKVCATPELLRKHCEKKHKEANCAFKPAAGGKRQLSILKASFLNNKIYTKIKCQHCSYECSTKIALIRHVRVQHMNAVTKDCGYTCVLCSRQYYRKQRLSDHYSVKHGKDAYLKYFVPIYGQVSNSPNRLSTQQLQKPKTKQILVYKCPSCPYVNASYHGTLTHCQMKHPALTVRADELQTCEILLTNFVKCDLGKSSNERGYMCRKCPQIHASLKKLKMHCLKSHNASDASEITLEIEKLQSRKGSASQASPIQNKCPERGHDGCSDSPEISPSNSPSGQKNMLYRCQLCNYKGYYRRYLQSHYKKAHKLDAQSSSKLLEKYNKYKKANVLPQSDQAATCKKCPNLTFKSSALLIEHYSSSHCIMDFTVLSLGVKHKSTGAYKCVHCDMHLNGTKKLAFHLDRHKESRTLKAATASPEQKKSLTFSWNEDLPTLETTDELSKWNVTPARTFSIPASPLSSPSELTDVDRSEPESRYLCKQCRRTFMSLKGLRTHERSHAAMAAIKKIDRVPISTLKEKMAKYVLYKPGTLRPYMCSLCPYRTPVMALLWSHFMKKHRAECSELDMDPAEPDNEESAEPADKGPKKLPKVEDDPDECEESMYLEPPDVQRQLSHYNMMAQSKSRTLAQESKFTENSLYHCELCNFSSGHLSSIRRHYLNCHGKKMLRCKDCRFFTGLRKTLEMHMETGHSTCQSKPTHDKDLRCPFCLYQTKNKNNMIDHIILHREERVVPIEVRRPKLSRYLQGIVFRCHKCTFTSGTPDNLRLHMTKHDDVKPYKCRLCYFDCTRLSDLEAHLSDKHQVVRNHELVGQVSLDQLEASSGRRPGEEEEEEEEPKLEQQNSDSEDKEADDSNDCNNTPIETDTDQQQGENSSGSDIQCEDANTTPPQQQAETVGLQDTTTEQGTGNEGGHSDAEKETSERRGEDGISAQQREEAASHCNNTLPLDEDGVQRTVKMEPDTESDDEPSHRMSTDEDQMMTSITCERSSVNVSPSSAREESLDVAKCKEEQVQRNCDEIMESYGEMPVLENEYLKEERIALGCCKEEEEEEEYYSDQKQEIKVEDGDESRCSDQDGTEESSEDSSNTQEKLYICQFCGRNLTSSSELKRHIMRHGI